MTKGKGSFLRALWGVAVFIPLTLATSTAVLVLTALHLISPTGAHRIARFWARTTLWAIGVKVHLEGADNIPLQGGLVLIANHKAVFDILAVMAAVPVDFRWVAKLPLFKIPFLGWAMRRCGYLPVDRSGSGGSITLLKGAARKVTTGTNVMIFPEGTRNRQHRTGLLPFKKGGFVVARLAGRPVVPLGLVGTEDILDRENLKVVKAPIRIRVGPPLDPAEFDRAGIDDFAAAARSSLESLVYEAGQGQGAA